MEYQTRLLTKSEGELWDSFVALHSLGNIHQTSGWGEFQSGRGKEWRYWILGIFDNGKLSGGALILRRRLPLGRCWLYIPKGPLLDYGTDEGKVQLKALLKELNKLVKKERAVYLRVEPGLLANGPAGFGRELDFCWQEAGFRPAHAQYQPEHTLVLEIDRGEAEILAQMKPKGRYNIKLAEKKGVEVLLAGRDMDKHEAVQAFHQLLLQTTSRDGFAGHPEKYYLNMLDQLGEKQALLYLARWEGKIIAGIVVTFYGPLAIYYFGASANEYRNVMAPYLLQWTAIREARKRGQKWYDFLGTAPLREVDGEFNCDPGHSWAGVTEFKLKFGGKRVNFYPGQELVYKPVFYWLMLLRKLLRR